MSLLVIPLVAFWVWAFWVSHRAKQLGLDYSGANELRRYIKRYFATRGWEREK